VLAHQAHAMTKVADDLDAVRGHGVRDLYAATEADLPEDIDALRALVLDQSRMLAEERASKDAQLAELALAKGEADAEIERLQAIIDAFMRHRFGTRSEQLDPDQLQLGLEDVDTALGQARAVRDVVSQTARGDKSRKTNRGSLPAHLERIEQVVDVEDKDCPCCGGALHPIAEDVAERLDVVTTTFRVLVTRRPRYACRACQSTVVQAPLRPARWLTRTLVALANGHSAQRLAELIPRTAVA
jgi:hypothetical protein